VHALNTLPTVLHHYHILHFISHYFIAKILLLKPNEKTEELVTNNGTVKNKNDIDEKTAPDNSNCKNQ